jgi:dTDP-4-amino-4,6-dideoxygalactose transaminase
LLDYLVKAYHLDKKVHFPPDYLDQMLQIEARVGLLQLSRYPEIVRRREIIAQCYDRNFQNVAGLTLPPIVEGASYSHYVPRLAKRESVLDTMRRRGVEVGRLIDYSIPHMGGYQRYAEGVALFPNSMLCSQTTINLPEHANLTEDEINLIVSTMRDVLGA